MLFRLPVEAHLECIFSCIDDQDTKVCLAGPSNHAYIVLSLQVLHNHW